MNVLFLDFDGVLNTNHNNNREIDHYVIINDLSLNNSDLKKVRNLLVKTKFYSVKKEDEGLIEIHKKK